MLLSLRPVPAGGRVRTVRASRTVRREHARLLAVARFARPSEAALAAAQRGAQAAAALLDAPIGLCTLVHEEAVRILGCVGLEGLEALPREPGLCLAAVGSGRPRIVERADLDRRTCEHSLVRGPAGLRSYAGVPLLTGDGFEIGTLAAGWREHRVPETRALAALEALAGLVVAAFEAGPPETALREPVTGLPGRRCFEERLTLLEREQTWTRSWGATLSLDLDASDSAARALAAALRAGLAGSAELFALDRGELALIAGVEATFDARGVSARVDHAVRAVRAADACSGMRVGLGVATYEERATPKEAYRLAQWRAYAEKADPR